MDDNMVLHLVPIEDGFPETERLILVRQEQRDYLREGRINQGPTKIYWRICICKRADKWMVVDEFGNSSELFLNVDMITHWAYLEGV